MPGAGRGSGVEAHRKVGGNPVARSPDPDNFHRKGCACGKDKLVGGPPGVCDQRPGNHGQVGVGKGTLFFGSPSGGKGDLWLKENAHESLWECMRKLPANRRKRKRLQRSATWLVRWDPEGLDRKQDDLMDLDGWFDAVELNVNNLVSCGGNLQDGLGCLDFGGEAWEDFSIDCEGEICFVASAHLPGEGPPSSWSECTW